MTGTASTEDTGTVECRRCHRALRSEVSKAMGVGPRCAAIEAATEGLNARQVDKMAQLLIDKAIVATSRKGVYHVVNEAGEVVHVVHVNGNCSCEWGRRRVSAQTKVCYQVGAARLLATPLIRKPQPVLKPVALPAAADVWAALEATGALDLVPAF
jgi:hypothetical protein